MQVKAKKTTTLLESFTESIRRKLVGSFEASEPGPPLGSDPGTMYPLNPLSLAGLQKEIFSGCTKTNTEPQMLSGLFAVLKINRYSHYEGRSSFESEQMMRFV